MPLWNVLMRTEDWVQVEAQSPEDAEMTAFRMYQLGDVRPSHPIFICEACDLEED